MARGIIYFSERDMFSIDLFVADAKDRQGHQESHEHRHQFTLREPLVPDLGGSLGSVG